MKLYFVSILLIISVLFSYTPIRYLCVKKTISNIYDEKTDLADDDSEDNFEDETEYEKDTKALFGNMIQQFHAEIFDIFTQASYYYLFKHYYVIEDNPTPPPEFAPLYIGLTQSAIFQSLSIAEMPQK